MTQLTGSPRYIVIYTVGLIFITTAAIASFSFPNTVGKTYAGFLRRHSSAEAFGKYCGNPLSAIKAAIKNPELIKVIIKNGGMKIVSGTLIAAGVEHGVHTAKLNQVYEYKMEAYMNDGVHPTKEPFMFKPNGPSMIEKLIGRHPPK